MTDNPEHQPQTQRVDAAAIENRSVPELRSYQNLLAVERNLLAWIRTGLSMMGFGFVVARFGLFLREMSAAMNKQAHLAHWHQSVSAWIGVGMVLLGVVVTALGAVQYRRMLGKLNRGEPIFPAPESPAVLVALLLAALGAGLVAYLITMAQ